MPTAAERYNFADVEQNGKQFISEMFKQCKVHEVGSMTPELLVKLGTKDVLAQYLMSALQLIERQHNFVINQRVHISSYQHDIIKLQSDVIAAHEKTLRVTEYISKTVEGSVQAGFKSYSEAVGAHGSSMSTVISPGTLKSVAKQVVVEEELSRNIMVFGLPEEENEDICENIGKVFQQLGEKPRVEASRLGKKLQSNVRPVKVMLSSATAVQHILAKSRELRQSDKYKTVFLSPDRTIEQRAEHRVLVVQLKNIAEAEPHRRHYIRGGQICSADSTKTQMSE